MEVHIGTSVEMADTSWRRQDITLDETDLKRLLIAAGLEPDAFVPTQIAFLILEAEAQRLLMAMMISRFSTMMNSDENKKQMLKYQHQRDAYLNSLKEKPNGE